MEIERQRHFAAVRRNDNQYPSRRVAPDEHIAECLLRRHAGTERRRTGDLRGLVDGRTERDRPGRRPTGGRGLSCHGG